MIFLVEAIVIAVYGCSLFLPAFLFARNSPVMGRELMFWGWWGVLMFNAGWLANPLLFGSIACFLLKNLREARILGTGAMLVSLHSFFVKQYFFNEGSGTPIESFGSAVYVWLAAIALQCGIVWFGSRLLPH